MFRVCRSFSFAPRAVGCRTGMLRRPGLIYMCQSRLQAQSPREHGVNRQCQYVHFSVCRRARTPPDRDPPPPPPAPAPAQGSAIATDRACGCEEEDDKQCLCPISCVRFLPLMPDATYILLDGAQTVFICARERTGQGTSKCRLSFGSPRLLLSPPLGVPSSGSAQ